MTDPANQSGLVLVTGASGNVGAPLVTVLQETGEPVIRATVGSVDHVPDGSVRRVDFEDPSTFVAALEGVDRVFLMRPPQISDTKRYIRPFIEAMATARVSHVVFLSLMGVNRAMPHWQVEQDLRSSALPWTFLRPSFFAQNLGAAYRDDIRLHDRIRLASGRGRTSFIDTRDVAAVAARVLADPTGHQGQAYTLTGPAALTYDEVASRLSATLGRPIDYQPIGLWRYRRELRAQHLPDAFVNVQLLINVVARLGLAARTTTTIAQMLGHPAGTFDRYTADHKDLWTDPADPAPD
jgi:uncharacterized protein YbjT (DUF2867 family)